MIRNQNESLSPRPFILASAVLVTAWLVVAWLFAHTYVSRQASQVFVATESNAHEAIDELHKGMHKILTYLHVVPDLAGRETIFHRALKDLNYRGNFAGKQKKDIKDFFDNNPNGKAA